MAAVSFSSSAIVSSPTTTTAFWRAGQPKGRGRSCRHAWLRLRKNPGGSLDPLDYRHPIVRKFRGQEKAGLLRSPIDQYFKVKLAEAIPGEQGQAAVRGARRPSPAKGEVRNAQSAGRPPAEVVLALSNGDPLIVAQPIRRGRIVLVTTSADASWSQLPKWGTYEPLVKEILFWCIAGQAQPRNIEVGDPLESALPATPALMDVSIERPGGQHRAVPLEVQGDYSTWRYDDTLISGIYTAHFAAPLWQSQLFAVNLMTAESDLAPISQDELQNEVWPGLPLGLRDLVARRGHAAAVAGRAVRAVARWPVVRGRGAFAVGIDSRLAIWI